MKACFSTLAAAALVCLFALSEAGAQGLGRNTGSSFGSSGFGTSSGASTFGSSGFGNSGFGNTGFGNTGFGASGLGSSFGTGGLGGNAFGSSGMGGTLMNGLNPGNTDGFVGRSQQDMQTLFQNQNLQTSFLNSNAQQRTQRNQQRSDQGAAGATELPPVRVRLRVAFDAPPLPTSSLVAATVERLPQIGIAGASVQMEGRTAVLQGTVADDHQRRLAERIVSLEPGVSEVRNELTITETAEPNP